MGYDVEPLVTLESKRSVLRRAREEGWRLMFEHDARVAWGHVAHDGRQYRLAEEAPPDVRHRPGTGPVPGQGGGGVA
jgi:hypothetical protein